MLRVNRKVVISREQAEVLLGSIVEQQVNRKVGYFSRAGGDACASNSQSRLRR